MSIMNIAILFVNLPDKMNMKIKTTIRCLANNVFFLMIYAHIFHKNVLNTYQSCQDCKR